MFIDLIERLPQEDKTKIENFIYSYGINKDDFLGLDDWLQNWNHSKQNLYKAMGEKFIISFPVDVEKSEEEISYEIIRTYRDHVISSVVGRLLNHCWNLYDDQSQKSNELNDLIGFIHSMKYSPENYFVKNKTPMGIKIKLPNKENMLQIGESMNAMRALKRLLEYFKDDVSYNPKDLEDFRIKLSMIYMNTKIHGEFCISIHPLDFMTMSSNSLNWHSCMSWVREGCYKIGTVEMMNSNNVVCCYLKSDIPYNFAEGHENDPLYQWNNKKWRCLYYMTKDILLSGKSYPFYSEALAKKGLEAIVKLTKDNLNYHYSQGICAYKDMVPISSSYKNFEYEMDNRGKDNKIFMHTNGMYNDMFNDINYKYWCYRNPVKINKRYSVSGKAPCLKCGDTVIEWNEENYNDYNDRYNNTGTLLCTTCIKNYRCVCCEEDYPVEKPQIFTFRKRIGVNNPGAPEYITKTGAICKDCYDKYARVCPCCGRPFFLCNNMIDGGSMISSSNAIFYYNHNNAEDIDKNYYDYRYITFREGVINPNTLAFEDGEDKIEYWKDYLFMCEDCYISNHYNKENDIVKKLIISARPKKTWWAPAAITYFMTDSEKAQKFTYMNLERIKEKPETFYVNYCAT